jgi:dTDP-4-dehydrorhamnose reductase
MRVLVTGGGGQLATEISRSSPSGVALNSLRREECDVTNVEQVFAVVQRTMPDLIINAAAYTAVDRAESEVEAAFAVNAVGAGTVAAAAASVRARVIQLSTDYVFGGDRSSPYPVSAEPRPLNVYGSSKLAGEIAVRESGARVTIIRCGWLFAATGNNFLLTVLRRVKSGSPLRVVNDQVGVPSSCRDLADFIWWCAQNVGCAEIMHWTNAGVASWYDFAVAIVALAMERSLISGPVDITAISSDEYEGRARRPKYSVLDASESWTALGGHPDHWRVAAAKTLDEYIARI